MRSTSESTGIILVRRIYDIVEKALWALGIVMTLALLYALQHLPEARAAFERNRTLEILDENRTYCTKWGMRYGTREYAICTMDLNEIREKQVQRMSDDLIF